MDSHSEPGSEAMRQIEQALRSGNKISAIKLYREATGANLATSKNAVEAMELDELAGDGVIEPPAPSMHSHHLPAKAISLLGEGKTIDAIRVVRETHGVGLKQAKQIVDRYLAANPGVRMLNKSSAGGWFIAVVGATIAAAIAWFIARAI